MDMSTLVRNDSDIEWALLRLHIDVPLDHIKAWDNVQAAAVAQWCLLMSAGNERDGLCVQPVPDALRGYVMAYGQPTHRRMEQD